jgi:hypothetical protein
MRVPLSHVVVLPLRKRISPLQRRLRIGGPARVSEDASCSAKSEKTCYREGEIQDTNGQAAGRPLVIAKRGDE